MVLRDKWALCTIWSYGCYSINYAVTQVAQWHFQNKRKSGWTGANSFVLEVPNLCPSMINNLVPRVSPWSEIEAGAGVRFSKAPETFRARKAIAKSRSLRLQSCLIHIVLTWTEAPFIQEVSTAYTSPFLDTEELKMALRARKVFGAFEKRATEHKSYNKDKCMYFFWEDNYYKWILLLCYC